MRGASQRASPVHTYFVDTNVLLYSLDLRDTGKRDVATAWLDYLWQSGHGRLSWQVLNEFYANAIRKMGLPAKEARVAVELFAAWKPGGFSLEMLQRAWKWMDAAQLSYWDAMILASAERQGCTKLLSEDFQVGRRFDSVEIVNPFSEFPPARP